MPDSVDVQKVEVVPNASENEAERLLPSPTQLSPLRLQYITMLNSGQYSHEECARILGVTPRSLYNWRQDPVFRHFFNESRKPLISRLNMLKIKAAHTLGRLLDSDDDRVRFAACALLLKDHMAQTATEHEKNEQVAAVVNELEGMLSEEERHTLAYELRQAHAGNGSASHTA